MKQVVINTDASFYRSMGAWAYWIALPDGNTIKEYGMIPNPVDNSSMAELHSFEIALDKTLALYNNTPLDITFFCDNLWVVQAMNGDIRRHNGTTAEHMAAAHTVYMKTRPHNLSAYHVKSHEPRLVTMAQRANNWCDFHARETVRRELRKINDIDIDFAHIGS